MTQYVEAPAPSVGPEFESQAEVWFPGDAWVRSAGKQFRDGNRFLFFNHLELSDDRRVMRVEPLAAMWMSEDASDEEPPLTLTAAGAQLVLSEPLTLEDGQVGAISGGTLPGDVRIRGPRGLRIDGRNINVSEDSLRIWSSFPVDFSFDGHSGRAENGMEITLSAPEGKDSGLLDVRDIRTVRLLGRTVADLQFSERDKAPVRLHVSAARGFDYDFRTNIATFRGIPVADAELHPDNQILVQSPTENGQPDQLFCSQLTMYLRPRISEDTGKGRRRLTLDQVVAEGRKVVFQSATQDLTAIGNTLRYSPEQRRLDFSTSGTDASGQPEECRLVHSGSVLTTPVLRIITDEKNEVRELSCPLPGTLLIPARIEHQGTRRPAPLRQLAWGQSLNLTRRDVTRILMDGEVTLVGRNNSLELRAESLELVAVEAPRNEQELPREAAGETILSSLDFGSLKPQSAVATKNVRLTTPDVSGVIRDRAVLHFAMNSGRGLLPKQNNERQAQSSGRPRELSDGNETDKIDPMRISAQQLEATVALPSERRPTSPNSREDPELRKLRLEGDVHLSRVDGQMSESMEAEGNILFLETNSTGSRQINLYGAPAKLIQNNRQLEGPRVEFSETERTAVVHGGGHIRLVVDRGPDGRLLERPAPLDVTWLHEMRVAGNTARFIGGVRATIDDPSVQFAEVRCDSLLLGFTRRLFERQDSLITGADLGVRSAASGLDAEIRSIRCSNSVSLEARKWVNGEFDAGYTAELVNLEIDVDTGAIQASGPGWLQSTQANRRDSEDPANGFRLKLNDAPTARANSAAQLERSGYVFVHAKFIGSLKGNLRSRLLRLEQHVEGVFGPVREPTDLIDVTQLSAEAFPEQTGVLRCEQLTVAALPSAVPGDLAFSLLADRNARLESRLLSGQADRITYDHGKDQFILSSSEGRNATIFHRSSRTGDYQRMVSRRFEFYPQRNHVSADEIYGLQAVR